MHGTPREPAGFPPLLRSKPGRRPPAGFGPRPVHELAAVGLGGRRYLTIGLGTDETLVGVDDHSTWAYKFPGTDVEE